jgi:cytochrome c-type biogenesis protein CcmH/NrfG
MKIIFIASALVLLFVAPAGVWAQFGGPGMPTDGMGHMETPEMKASAALSRGLKLKKKAEGEPDTTKRIKLLEKAKEELSKSLAYAPDFDTLLALGQVYLGMGKADSALDACSQAQALRPNDAPPKACIVEARKKTDKPDTETKAAGGRQ